jgi:hypothetical protein
VEQCRREIPDQQRLGRAENSEYQVTGTGYTRYAPVNIKQKLFNRVHSDSPDRSFVDLVAMPADLNTPQFDALYEKGQAQSLV